MKKLITYLLIIITILTSYAQQPGTLDTTFNVGTGTTLLNNGQDNTGGVDTIALQPDGKIIIYGNFNYYNGVYCHGFCRLNSDGSLDTTFISGTGPDSSVSAIAFQPDGKILIGGNFTMYNGVTATKLARLNPDGSLDTTINFNPTGSYYFNGVHDSIIVQPDGKILVAGEYTLNGFAHYGPVRLLTNGSLDTSFNYLGPNFGPNSLLLQADGNVIMAGGLLHYGGIIYNGIGRLNTTGQFDTTFSANVGSGTSSTSSLSNKLALQPDGKILIYGTLSQYNGVARNLIARLNSDGSLDTTFDGGTGINSGTYNFLAAQPDGRIVVCGGFTQYNGFNANHLARLNSDGSLDSNFNIGSGPNSAPDALALQPDGKILVAGSFNTYNGIARHGIVRINGGNALDSASFMEEKTKLTIYPNPTKSFLTLQTPNNVSLDKITITDLTGKTILEQTNNTNQVNVEQLACGMYIIDAVSGQEKFTAKFVKE